MDEECRKDVSCRAAGFFRRPDRSDACSRTAEGGGDKIIAGSPLSALGFLRLRLCTREELTRPDRQTASSLLLWKQVSKQITQDELEMQKKALLPSKELAP